MTFTVGKDFNLSVGNNMNATVGNNHTMSVTNDNMLLVQNNHTLEANNYGQTLQGNYNQSIQGKKLVAVTGNMEETSAAYYHTAQSGNVIIQSANISKLLGKVDAFVNKSGFQKPRYFIEDVSDKKEKSEKQRGEQKKTLVQELHDDIIAKLKPANYTGNERKYVEGALKHIDFLVDENVNFVKEAIWSGLYDGKLNIKDDGETTRDDLKVTIFHEYLHHVNYMEKIYPYRYSDESKRQIFQIEDECYIFREATMDEVFYDFIVLTYKVDDPNWQYTFYEEIKSDKQRQEVQRYKKENEEKFQKKCKKGNYYPSNYYRDEITVHTICLKENHSLFIFSDKKENLGYKRNLLSYKEELEKSIDYEKRKNHSEQGYPM